MRELPAGTVTFLFTDVEGSTKLLQELGSDEYAEALGEHRRIVRDALAQHSGIEVDTQGDAFFCVFPSAREAAACASNAQEQLAETPLRVRMGLHSGEALVDDGNYVGMDVHRGARVAAAGHGGQVLVSPTTAPLLEPDSFTLRDLGEHRLKDLSAPLRIYQLGDAEFPRLKTLHRTNLPVPATPFLGRRSEVATVVELAGNSNRLLTLTGPGGTGKTRLALQAAAELAESFPGGVFWVPLAPLRDPSLIGSAVAAALDVDEEGGGDVVASIGSSVTASTLLLVDNCEHVLDGVAAVLAPLLRSSENVRVIATSREPLLLTGERVLPVDPLTRADAIELFRSRAEAAGAGELDEEAVAAVCARLDDLPLAIELAAARAVAIPPALLLERLSHRLELLRGPRDADERQRTLRAAIAWSHDLLTAEEQRVFRRFSVFVGGTTIESLEEVAEADVDDVASLVAKSLVRVTPSVTGPRYWMLETIREFAADQLAESDDPEPLQERYVRFFAGLAKEAEPVLDEEDAAVWLERLELEVGNLRAALPLVFAAGDVDVVPLALALGRLHTVHGRYAEAAETLSGVSVPDDAPLGESKRLRLLAEVLSRRDDVPGTRAAFDGAERVMEAVADRDEAWWKEWLDLKIDDAAQHYWNADLPSLDRAVQALRPSIEQHASPRQRLTFLHTQVLNRLRRDGYVLSEETEQLARELHAALQGADSWDADFHLGFTLLWRGKLDEASAHLRSGLQAARRVGDVLYETRCLVYGAVAMRKLGETEAVRELDRELAKLDDPYGYAGLIAGNRAWLAWRDGDFDAAERWGAAALEDWARVGRSGPTVFQWSARFPLLAVDVERGRIDSACEHGRAMLDERQQALPSDVSAGLAEAVGTHSDAAFSNAIALARPLGYT